jgi:hypothetical protein
LLLSYCLVSAVNARATFRDDTLTFDYHECITWLPHSFDATASWSAFWRYLGLACAFWAIIDWLPGRTSAEQRARLSNPAAAGMPAFPARLRRLLWILAVNGALLGVEGIVQRLADSSRLLFLVLPRIHQTAVTQFGPYAYRSNAAQYFNLLWPVCLGFWWTLKQTRGGRSKAYPWLLVCAAVMAACPLISTSRAGALVTLGIAVSAAVILVATHFLFAANRKGNSRPRGKTFLSLALFFCASLGFGLTLGWQALAPRLEQLEDGFQGRRLMYEAARPMADDFPLYGTGPGTFETASYLYPRPDIFWPPQLHNDWLETRITFGYVGCALLCLALGTVGVRWFMGGGIHGGRRFVALTWLTLAGCMMHARFDFPFQVHSILLLFLVLCAILFTRSRR